MKTCTFFAISLIGIFLLAVPVLGAEPDDRAPLVGDKLKVPAGHTVLLKADAKGVQIYKSIEDGGKLKWVFEAPLAKLFDAGGKFAGYHFEGPAWESADGSRVRKIDDKDAVIKDDAPNAKEDVPWLLIKVKADEGKDGALGKAVYVHRINTKGGQPPSDAPLRAGTKIGVEYSATYVFYARKE
jgi:hypothetical protein